MEPLKLPENANQITFFQTVNYQANHLVSGVRDLALLVCNAVAGAFLYTVSTITVRQVHTVERALLDVGHELQLKSDEIYYHAGGVISPVWANTMIESLHQAESNRKLAEEKKEVIAEKPKEPAPQAQPTSGKMERLFELGKNVWTHNVKPSVQFVSKHLVNSVEGRDFSQISLKEKAYWVALPIISLYTLGVKKTSVVLLGQLNPSIRKICQVALPVFLLCQTFYSITAELSGDRFNEVMSQDILSVNVGNALSYVLATIQFMITTYNSPEIRSWIPSRSNNAATP